MAKRIFLFSSLMVVIATLMGWVVWNQELQYALPTPVPVSFKEVKTGSKIDLSALGAREGRNTVLHFFNLQCPCSRFNMKEFESLAHDYKDQVDFFVVIQSDKEEAIEKFKKRYDVDVPVILDTKGEIADKCGIYSTPQAAVLTNESVLYFKGNYNKTRFCTRKETKFVELALTSLLKNEPLPLFVQYAVTEPYGCTLPSDENTNTNQLLNLF